MSGPIQAGRVWEPKDPDVQIAGTSDPWLQSPDGTVLPLSPLVAALPRDPATDCVCEGTGVFAPTGNGPTEEGIERCDGCARYPGDLHAAAALAALAGPDVTVRYVDERDR